MNVVIGVVLNAEHHILLAKRPPDKSYSGLWEFPGGKIEQFEEPLAALAREMQEEIGIQLQSAYFLGEIIHPAPQSSSLQERAESDPVHFFVYVITQFEGEPAALENQPALQWVSRDRLDHLTMLPANGKIVDLMNLMTSTRVYSPHFQNLGEKTDLRSGCAKNLIKSGAYTGVCEHF